VGPIRVFAGAIALVAGCTSWQPSEATDKEPPSVQTPGPDENEPRSPPPQCTLRFGQDPYVRQTSPLAPTALRDAAAWTKSVDAVGGYQHRVDFDGDGNVVWAHDSRSMRFTLTKLTPTGEQLWHRVLEPRQHQPEVLTATESGTILVAGTAFAGEHGQPLVAIDPEGEMTWRQHTPRVSVGRLASAPGGRTVMVGSSHRREVTLGDHTMSNAWLGPGRPMDVLAVLDARGEYEWSRAYFPGVLDMSVVGEAVFLAGNFGDFAVDYGGGPVAGPGVLARLDLPTGEHRWSLHFETGLRAVVPQDDDLLVVGFPPPFTSTVSMGGPHVEGAPAAWIDADGCYRGSMSLGAGIGRVAAGRDGSLVLSGLATDLPPGLRIGTTAFEVPVLHWFIARLDPTLELTMLHASSCDGIDAAAGPHGQVAVSCMRDLSTPGKLVRRYELFLVE
jgi:hypothetical protein